MRSCGSTGCKGLVFNEQLQTGLWKLFFKIRYGSVSNSWHTDFELRWKKVVLDRLRMVWCIPSKHDRKRVLTSPGWVWSRNDTFFSNSPVFLSTMMPFCLTEYICCFMAILWMENSSFIGSKNDDACLFLHASFLMDPSVSKTLLFELQTNREVCWSRVLDTLYPSCYVPKNFDRNLSAWTLWRNAVGNSSSVWENISKKVFKGKTVSEAAPQTSVTLLTSYAAQKEQVLQRDICVRNRQIRLPFSGRLFSFGL